MLYTSEILVVLFEYIDLHGVIFVRGYAIVTHVLTSAYVVQFHMANVFLKKTNKQTHTHTQ